MSSTIATQEALIAASPLAAQRMNIVIVGHVDHGKSTVIGRLLADTHSLPEGKLEQVRAQCELNSKPFEYAFLLDALKDEQAQGITIDAVDFNGHFVAVFNEKGVMQSGGEIHLHCSTSQRWLTIDTATAAFEEIPVSG